jgi:hypothetical protein
MKRFRRLLFLVMAVLALVALVFLLATRKDLPTLMRRGMAPGTPIDSLHGVLVYHNGGMDDSHGRNVVDGYNVGLRYQCVEFVKRYYLEVHGHRMPEPYGHARDFFAVGVPDGGLNPARGLVQFTNPGSAPPAVGDILVLDAWAGNPLGHVAIVSAVHGDRLEVVQQNTLSPRDWYRLVEKDGQWRVGNARVRGWLRMP